MYCLTWLPVEADPGVAEFGVVSKITRVRPKKSRVCARKSAS